MPTLKDTIAGLRAYERSVPQSFPAHLRDLLESTVYVVSPVQAIVMACEILYANLSALDDAGKELCISLTGFAVDNVAPPSLTNDDRGLGIIKSIKREMGKESASGSWPTPAEDPVPLLIYLPPADATPSV